MVVFWRLCELNAAFVQHCVATPEALLHIVAPILYHINQCRLDPSMMPFYRSYAVYFSHLSPIETLSHVTAPLHISCMFPLSSFTLFSYCTSIPYGEPLYSISASVPFSLASSDGPATCGYLHTAAAERRSWLCCAPQHCIRQLGGLRISVVLRKLRGPACLGRALSWMAQYHAIAFFIAFSIRFLAPASQYCTSFTVSHQLHSIALSHARLSTT